MSRVPRSKREIAAYHREHEDEVFINKKVRIRHNNTYDSHGSDTPSEALTLEQHKEVGSVPLKKIVEQPIIAETADAPRKINTEALLDQMEW
jgi:hypothetical protein